MPSNAGSDSVLARIASFASHAHYAVRGTIPRRLIKEVARETYQQIWWPPFDHPVYHPDRPPTWDEDQGGYTDPKTGKLLPTWQQAKAAISDDQELHLARLGTVDVRGIEQGTQHAERAIRYATKYLTKDLVDAHLIKGDAQRQHFERLHAELSVLPCSERCANWLLYGVQPNEARRGLVPGRCKGKVHQPATLGYTGRRCLVSRNWSNKTLTDHRLDGREWFRAVTAGLLDDQSPAEGNQDQRFYYELAGPKDLDVPPQQQRIFRSIANRQRATDALLRAKRAGADGTPSFGNSGTSAATDRPTSIGEVA